MTTLKTVILTGAAIAMLALSPVPASAAKCKKPVTGYAKAVGESGALSAAKASWKERAAEKYGPAYIKPKNVKENCSVYDASLFLHQCTYKARACPVTIFKAPKTMSLSRQ